MRAAGAATTGFPMSRSVASRAAAARIPPPPSTTASASGRSTSPRDFAPLLGSELGDLGFRRECGGPRRDRLDSESGEEFGEPLDHDVEVGRGEDDAANPEGLERGRESRAGSRSPVGRASPPPAPRGRARIRAPRRPPPRNRRVQPRRPGPGGSGRPHREWARCRCRTRARRAKVPPLPSSARRAGRPPSGRQLQYSSSVRPSAGRRKPIRPRSPRTMDVMSRLPVTLRFAVPASARATSGSRPRRGTG